jgi:hypothetical protein
METQEHQQQRYTVVSLGEGYAVRDREQGGSVVRYFKSMAIAQSCALFGNVLGRCQTCHRPATVKVGSDCLCVDCIPAYEEWGLIPLQVLRLWSESEHR